MAEKREVVFRRIRGRIVPIKKVRTQVGEALELGGTALALGSEAVVAGNLHGRKAIQKFGKRGTARRMGLTFNKHKTIHKFGRRLGKIGAVAAVAGLLLKPEKTAKEVSEIGQTAGALLSGNASIN